MTTTASYIQGIVYPVPGLGGDSPSTAANKIVTSLQAIDSHAHTGNDGRKLGVASFTIDTNVNWNSYRIDSIGSVVFQNVPASPAIANTVYVQGGELYFRDNSSNDVKITVGGAVNVGLTGTITGMTGSAGVGYVAGSKYYDFIDETGSTRASLLFNKAKLQNTNGNIINIQVDAPTNGYDITLPNADPADDQFLMSNASGTLTWQKAVVNEGVSPASNRMAYWTDSKTLGGLPVLGPGQLYIGTGSIPTVAGLTGTTNQITITTGSGTITLSLPQNIHMGATPTFAGLNITGSATIGANISAVNANFTGTFASTGINTLANLSGGGDGKLVVASNTGVLSTANKLSTAATPDTVVLRDGSGNCNFNNIGAVNLTLSGNISAVNYNAHVADTTSAHGATTTSTANRIVRRDGSGDVYINAMYATSTVRADGGVSTDGGSTYIKIKKIQATINGSGQFLIPHGLGSNTNIIGITARVSDSVNEWNNLPYSVGNTGTMHLWVESVNDTNVVLRGISYSFAKGVVIVLTYI